MNFVFLLILCAIAQAEICTKQSDCFHCVSVGCRYIREKFKWKCVSMSYHADEMVTKARHCRRLQRESEATATTESSFTMQNVTEPMLPSTQNAEAHVSDNMTTTTTMPVIKESAYFNDAAYVSSGENLDVNASNSDVLLKLLEKAEKATTLCKQNARDVKLALTLCRLSTLLSSQKPALMVMLSGIDKILDPHRITCKNLIRKRRSCRTL